MRILIADRLLTGRPHADWKEGWELYYAFRNLGISASIAGPGCPMPEKDIPDVASLYDFVIIVDNYPQGAWTWWDWAAIKIPKLFYAIDTHVKEFRAWVPGFVEMTKMDVVALNNPRDSSLFPGRKTFWLPYAASRNFGGDSVVQRERDVAFIGGPNKERTELFDSLGGVTTISAFGDDYLREMRKSRICLNLPISYDINAKYFEIPASGTFMLAKAHEELQSILHKDMQEMFWKDEQDLKDKILYYLAHDSEREGLATSARKYILAEHSWENRAKLILSQMGFEQR
jgi:hypothetical protein